MPDYLISTHWGATEYNGLCVAPPKDTKVKDPITFSTPVTIPPEAYRQTAPATQAGSPTNNPSTPGDTTSTASDLIRGHFTWTRDGTVGLFFEFVLDYTKNPIVGYDWTHNGTALFNQWLSFNSNNVNTLSTSPIYYTIGTKVGVKIKDSLGNIILIEAVVS